MSSSSSHKFLPHPLLIFLFHLILSPSTTPAIPSCSSSTCGDPTREFSYPFWIADDPSNPPSSFCGYPELMLYCRNRTPIIILPGGGDYTVAGIDNSSKTLSLVDSASLAHVPAAGCPHPLHNLSINGDSTFSYTSEDTDVIFFYNCSKTSLFLPLGCSSDGGDVGGYSYVSSSDALTRPRDCKEIVMAPLLRTEVLGILDLISGDVAGLVEKGFQLHWHPASDDRCRRCEGSGGHCGRNQTGFVCYCPGGTDGGDCSDGKAEGVSGSKFAGHKTYRA